MGHCPFEKLADLGDVLEVVRGWPGIKEKTPGVFYFKSIPFLHFHEKDGVRWADARAGENWGESIGIDFGATKAQRTAFQKEVRRRFELMTT